jgi:hypothetical protein
MPTLVLPCAGLIGAAEPAADLARQLGAPAFAAREQAAQQPRQRGRAVESAVRAGLTDADPEICQRCRSLLDQILQADRERRLKAFLKVNDDPKTLYVAG